MWKGCQRQWRRQGILAGMTWVTRPWESVITEDFSQPKDPVIVASSTSLMSHRVTVLICTAADKGQRTRMLLMKAKIQCKLETGMFKFLFSLRHARNGSSKNHSCHRNSNPLSQSSHWWQANGFIQICIRGTFHPSSRILPGLSSSSYGWLLGAFPAPSSPHSILCSSFTFCGINCRSCWNERKKEPLNQDHRIPPPQRRWTFSKKKCSWRGVFESSISDRR